MLFTLQDQERLLTQLQHFNGASVVSLTSGSGSLVGGGALRVDPTVQVCDLPAGRQAQQQLSAGMVPGPKNAELNS